MLLRLLSCIEYLLVYYIQFGNHGPRKVSPPGQIWKIAGGVAALLGLTGVLWTLIRSRAAEAPRTITKEWKEATNEYLKQQKAEPLTGVSRER